MQPPTSCVLYFQQVLPLGKCEARDGRVAGHLLKDLVEGKPRDLAHAIRTFANCMAMLRECGFPMAEFLVALMTGRAQGPNEKVAAESQSRSGVHDSQATWATKEQAAAIGRKLALVIPDVAEPAAIGRKLALVTPDVAVRKAVDLHSVLRTMNSRYIWFLPMLEVLLGHAAAHRRSTIARRLGSVITPARGPVASEESLIHVAPNAEGANEGSFDSVVRLALHPPVTVMKYLSAAVDKSIFMPV
jgi:hypothetical protein